ncbi:MAG: UDP-N-acetylmuramate dehydrogenase [bacterium]|nr:UDP-N-acetylmuramate dehydrogenase [bacterium]
MTIIIKENVPLAPLTTFNIGGAARYFVEAHSEDEIRESIAHARKLQAPFVILGGGSNVLVPDPGITGLVVRIACQEHSFGGGELAADAGCNLIALIREAAQKGLGGWEKLAGIPGTLGGAVRGNAGAFGTEIKDFVTKVVALDVETGMLKEFSNEICDFSYRHSFFKGHPEWIILHVRMRLNVIPSDISLYSIQETIAEREKRHLQNVQAAGSFFMNPVAPREVQELFEREKGQPARLGRVPAGWLIEKVGLKGATVGGAIASLQHPNYLVNTGNATAADVQALAQKIKDTVRKEFGIQLEEEAEVLVV